MSSDISSTDPVCQNPPNLPCENHQADLHTHVNQRASAPAESETSSLYRTPRRDVHSHDSITQEVEPDVEAPTGAPPSSSLRRALNLLSPITSRIFGNNPINRHTL